MHPPALHTRRIKFLAALDDVAAEDMPDAFRAETSRTGGLFSPALSKGSSPNQFEIFLYGIHVANTSEAAAIQNWIKCARATQEPAPPHPSPENHAEEIANVLAGFLPDGTKAPR